MVYYAVHCSSAPAHLIFPLGRNSLKELTYVDNAYRTPPRTPSLFARTLPSWLFYCHAFMIVWRGSALAKRGRYKTPEWCQSSLATLRALEQVGVRIDVTGTDAFTSLDGPCVFIGNHISTLKTLSFPRSLPRSKKSPLS